MHIKYFNYAVLLLVFSLFIGCKSQDASMRLRNVDDKYVKMTHYENDSTAKALILGDQGVSEIRYHNVDGFQNRFTRHLRVKIFDKDAFDIADFRIPLYGRGGRGERIINVTGYTYTEDNGNITRTRLRRRDQHEEVVSENLRTVNFTMPNIQEGSVFELEYTIISNFLYTLPSWYFQSEYPTVFSQYRIPIPEYFNYNPLVQGFHNLDSHESSRSRRRITFEWEEETFFGEVERYSHTVNYYENITSYRMDSIPGFKREPYMNSMINYLSKIDHELVSFRPPYSAATDYSSTWPQLTNRLLESDGFGKQLQNSDFLSDEIEKLASDYADPKERMVAAFELIQDKMTWNKKNSIYVSESLEKAWKDKQGNASDINLMLTMLLKELDIEAHPLLISTRNHGIINPAQVMLRNFNYVVTYAMIDDEVYLMDATENNNPYYLLPGRCINGNGRLISKNKSKWVELDASQDNNIHTKSQLNIKPCGSIQANLIRTKKDYPRLAKTNQINDYGSKDDYLDSFESDNTGVEVISFETKNMENWSKPLIINYELKIDELDTTPKEVLYINPMLIDQIESNPFRIEKRQFPVDFVFPYKRNYSTIIEIPEGYAVEELPDNAHFYIGDRDVKYVSSFNESKDNNIEVNIDFEINKALFTPQEYNDLKEFYSNVVEEQARNIVLKKL